MARSPTAKHKRHIVYHPGLSNLPGTHFNRRPLSTSSTILKTEEDRLVPTDSALKRNVSVRKEEKEEGWLRSLLLSLRSARGFHFCGFFRRGATDQTADVPKRKGRRSYRGLEFL